jgi:four helix bundle protein
MKTHKDLDVWKNGISLVTSIYEVTKLFPKEEIYGIISQIRRAAVSIPSNIAEGAARNHNKEFIQFLYTALASLAELETQLIISGNLNYLTNDKFSLLNNRMNEIRSQLCGLIKYLKKKS